MIKFKKIDQLFKYLEKAKTQQNVLNLFEATLRCAKFIFSFIVASM